MDAGQHDLRHPPKSGDEGMIMLQQFADDRGNIVGSRCRANGLQIAAGAERAAFALDHQHPDIIGRFDLRAELLQLFCDRKIDRVEGARAIEGDGGDRSFDPEQCRIVGRSDMVGRRHC